MKLPKLALDTWSWGSGMAGGDQVFGNHTTEESLKPVFDTAMKEGLNLWDTATVYGMGASEDILGEFVKDCPRKDVILSTKFTPQIAPNTENPVLTMCEESCKRLNTAYIDIYWIAGFKVSAIQNHFSLLYRSSEKAGILGYCKEHDITFFSYMTLEQGALTGVFGTDNPMPEGSQRAVTYNPILDKLDNLIAAMKEIGAKYDSTPSQIAIAYAINKGTLPIVGATKERHVKEAAEATKIQLTAEEISRLETLASETGVDTRGSWENPMA